MHCVAVIVAQNHVNHVKSYFVCFCTFIVTDCLSHILSLIYWPKKTKHKKLNINLIALFIIFFV